MRLLTVTKDSFPVKVTLRATANPVPMCQTDVYKRQVKGRKAQVAFGQILTTVDRKMLTVVSNSEFREARKSLHGPRVGVSPTGNPIFWRMVTSSPCSCIRKGTS